MRYGVSDCEDCLRKPFRAEFAELISKITISSTVNARFLKMFGEIEVSELTEIKIK